MTLYSRYRFSVLTVMVTTCAEARQVDQFEELKVNWTLPQRETNCNGTLSDGCYTPNYVADVFFFSCLIFLGTFVLSFYLKLFRNTRFFPNKASQIADGSTCRYNGETSASVTQVHKYLLTLLRPKGRTT